ncbi:hypothetical protein BDR06DRAFT_960069 [Suillus hirtellus]|nr:hypothetical protein BDR06DRAFT_960069 [Suillus hirtellus]
MFTAMVLSSNLCLFSASSHANVNIDVLGQSMVPLSSRLPYTMDLLAYPCSATYNGCFSAAATESGSGHSFLNTSFVNHPSPNENTIDCILALFFLILASRCRQDHPPPWHCQLNWSSRM